MLEPRPEIRTATRAFSARAFPTCALSGPIQAFRHRDALPRFTRGPRPARSGNGAAPRPPLDATDALDPLARAFQHAGDDGDISSGTTSTMPMPQLKVRAISAGSILPCACRNAIRRGCSHASASTNARQAFGQDARDIFQQAAAGDMGQRVDAPGADLRQQAFT
jgi:hypothetical protein